MNRTAPIIGQILFSLNVGNAARNREQKLTPVKVIAVGRKYFTTRPVGTEGNYADSKFNLDDWSQVSDLSPDESLYESRQDWLTSIEQREMVKQIRGCFAGGGSGDDLSLEKLRKILAIIKE